MKKANNDKDTIYTDKTIFKNISHEKFIEHIINGMQDWVRVIDIDDNIIYINRAMSKALKGSFIGEKCYKALGRGTSRAKTVLQEKLYLRVLPK
ncbi:hypothetical protein [Acetivibrio saccincola]|jgi:PAS domain-containing protein|uniref:hypothetical protein n=1 Tax=Acetivibrio saccincola TaxID=1677857 RepID=UPI001FA909EC|nr:hypothetical protein [Acetivibrio saccincola]